MTELLVSNFRQFSNLSTLKVLAIPLVLLAIMAMLVIPLPSTALDILFTFNIMTGLVIVMISVNVHKPLEFSSFPLILLIATMLRLSLNVASTRIVLLKGHEGPDSAGDVIASFGEFVIAGNYVVGFIIFIILMIINFIVVTKGAGRTSEVIARFTLDALPGKQMAIDADLNAGIINQEDALIRRQEVSQESDFFGSMDGASKFVRGDAIAGILILAINIIGGLIVGTSQHNLSFDDAAEIYILLTIGDGLVAQIPSLLLSLSTAIIVTRVTTTESTANQIGLELKNPTALRITSLVLFILGIIPGMPHLFFILGSIILFSITYINERNGKIAEDEEINIAKEAGRQESELDWSDIEHIDTIGLEIGYGLIPLVSENDSRVLLSRIKGIRKKLSTELGFLIQPIRIRDNLNLDPFSYNILLKGVVRAKGKIEINKDLAINPGDINEKLNGITTVEPAFGLDAYWINNSESDHAKTLGYTIVDGSTVIATHINALLKSNSYELLGHDETREILDKVSKISPKLVEDLVPEKLSIAIIMQVLRNLLYESITIKDIRTILATLLTESSRTQNADELTELVRPKIGHIMLQDIVGLGDELHVMTLDPSLEQILINSLENSSNKHEPMVDPSLLENLIKSIKAEVDKEFTLGNEVTIVVAPPLRPWLARFIKQRIAELRVFSYSEIPEDQKIKVSSRIGEKVESEENED
ncbi:flagellar biosynthesis protein FlhA [Gammaproteobacteria bacterium]|nr:flagellar biosynthesis protein FlhA [Gammaproteobacteria bacterium]